MSEEDEQVSRPSRYRSLRKLPGSAPISTSAKESGSGSHEPNQQHGNAMTNSVSRSMSRYRRRAASVTGGGMNSDPALAMNSDLNKTPPVPAIPPSLKATGPSISKEGHIEPTRKSTTQRQPSHTHTQRETTGQTTDDSDHHSSITHESNRNRPSMASQSTQHISLEQRDASWDAERDRLLEEQKRKDLQRLEEELENSQRAKSQAHKLRSPVVEKFVLLAKGGKSNKDEASPETQTQTQAQATTSARSSARRSGHEPANTPPAHIEPGGKGIVPQKDAPTSAINAGDRNVTVRCRHHTFNLPISPETTAVDIIARSASKLPWDLEISPERCLVSEQYSILGLERRLRRYEYIRDVMNSWDSDAQNQLVVTVPDTGDSHEDLDVSAVANSENAPPGCQLYMYHSNRPGKWNKRYITLLQSGQIICAKKPNAKTADKDTTSLCHLSDYDLYIPTESQMRRHIKPPKRFCFAIKSQHKTTLFLNTENYVQYFSTEDPELAREFKQKAHSWRSWYLVDRRPEVRKKHTGSVTKTEERLSPPQSPPTKHAPKKADNIASVDGHRLRVSVDESPYALGKFEPLIDMTRFDKRLSQFGKDFLPTEPEPPTKKTTDQTVRRRLSKRQKPEYKPPQASKRESGDGFTGGLLAEQYDNRKQALAELEKKKRPPELAFTPGPSLINSQQDSESPADKPESPSWFPSALEHTAKQRTVPQTTVNRPTTSAGSGGERRFSPTTATNRSAGSGSSAARPSTQHGSQHPHSHTQHYPNPLGSHSTSVPHPDRRMQPRPLVDLTPAIQEAPQWSKEKKGHGVKPPEGLGHLIDFISVGNGTEGKPGNRVEAPPRSHTVRRPTTSGAASVGRTRSMSSASAHGRPLLDDAPPVPLLPSRLALEGSKSSSSGRRLVSPPTARDARLDHREMLRQKDREQEKARLREREREQREREYREREAAYNAVPGRTGTLKVV
ncbi:hypothetical protein GGR51DRAFT_343546 [Nemania sp. FL0031]|nr:hypothetical protein GGR51DRAFT_343546 [Nemania sp. FL0031]